MSTTNSTGLQNEKKPLRRFFLLRKKASGLGNWGVLLSKQFAHVGLTADNVRHLTGGKTI
ncbi:hypothetical protein D3C76_573540 [compost metagenome]|jgi:hypothetical protein